MNDGNLWTWEKLYPVERKLRQMARDYADGPADEIVKQAAREMLLAEASDWQFLISTFAARDYSEIRFQDHIDRFNRLAAIADRVHTGGAMTPEEQAFLLDCQEKDAPFQELDLSLWAPLQSS
jgi:1,4-alpha-glucan branching enzyme